MPLQYAYSSNAVIMVLSVFLMIEKRIAQAFARGAVIRALEAKAF
jgi:hypothetical protein